MPAIKTDILLIHDKDRECTKCKEQKKCIEDVSRVQDYLQKISQDTRKHVVKVECISTSSIILPIPEKKDNAWVYLHIAPEDPLITKLVEIIENTYNNYYLRARGILDPSFIYAQKTENAAFNTQSTPDQIAYEILEYQKYL